MRPELAQRAPSSLPAHRRHRPAAGTVRAGRSGGGSVPGRWPPPADKGRPGADPPRYVRVLGRAGESTRSSSTATEPDPVEEHPPPPAPSRVTVRPSAGRSQRRRTHHRRRPRRSCTWYCSSSGRRHGSRRGASAERRTGPRRCSSRRRSGRRYRRTPPRTRRGVPGRRSPFGSGHRTFLRTPSRRWRRPNAHRAEPNAPRP
jgi:hypothetical protein